MRLTSQPLAGLLSQSAKPELRLATLHVAFEHEAVPLFAEQTLLQAPQLLTLLVRLVSQPLAALLSQSAKPALQLAILHVAFEHEDVPLLEEQTLLQAPQLATLLVRLVSQPLAGLLSQSAKPALQLPILHVAFEQKAVPLLEEQTLPHAPQLLTVLVRLVSQPLAALLSQFPKPALQLATPQTPFEQTAVPLAEDADIAACSAVSYVVGEVGFAAVRIVEVTVSGASSAGKPHTVTIHTGCREIPHGRTDLAAATAVINVGEQVGFAAVRSVGVAVSVAAITCADTTNSTVASRSGVGWNHAVPTGDRACLADGTQSASAAAAIDVGLAGILDAINAPPPNSSANPRGAGTAEAIRTLGACLPARTFRATRAAAIDIRLSGVLYAVIT